MLRCENLCKSYGNKQIIHDVNLSLEKGITGILGLPGSGKTTLLKLLMGLITPDCGSIRILGKNIQDESNPELIKEIGFSPNEAFMFDQLSARQNLEYVSTTKTGNQNWYHKLDKQLREFRLEDELDFPLDSFSASRTKLIQILASLIGNPKLLIWDEPFFKPGHKANGKIESLIGSSVAEDRLILFTGSYPAIMEKLCDRVLVFHNGTIIDDVRPPKGLQTIYDKLS